MEPNDSEKSDMIDPPPIFKTWRQMYIFVLVFHALVISAFYAATRYFS